MSFPCTLKFNDVVDIIYFLFLFSCQAKVHELAGDAFRFSVLDSIKRWIQVSHTELVFSSRKSYRKFRAYWSVVSPFIILSCNFKISCWSLLSYTVLMIPISGWIQEIHVEMLLLSVLIVHVRI